MRIDLCLFQSLLKHLFTSWSFLLHRIFLKLWTERIFSADWKHLRLLWDFQKQIHFIVFDLNVALLCFWILFLGIEETVDETLGYLSLTLFFVITKEIRRKNHFSTGDWSYSSSSSFDITWFASLLSTFLFCTTNLARKHRRAFIIYRLRRPLLCQIKIFRQRSRFIFNIML